MSNLPPLIRAGLITLYAKKPFYAVLCSSEVDFIRDDKLPAVAGVCYQNDRIKLFYNLEKLEEKRLDADKMSDVIYHELRHVVNGDVFGDNKGTLWNIAQDLSINDKIYNTATELNVVTVDKINSDLKCFLERDKNSQYYHAYLNEVLPKDKAQSFSTLDDHSQFDKSDSSEIAKAELSEKIKSTFERMKSLQPDKITSSLLEELSTHLESKVRWEKQLKNMIASTLNTTRRKTRSRLNRRLGLALQGTKKDEKFNIVVCTDTSGSMSNESLSQCWAEINSVYKKINCDIMVIEADCEIQSIKAFDPKEKPVVKGRGGTSYNPAIKKAMEFKPDLILFLGDFGCFDQPEDPKIPFIWVAIGTTDQPPANFGKVIYVK